METELSIVVPVFNRESVVERTLHSIEAQTFRPLKVILVDNGSTDGTMAVLQKWKERVRSNDFDIEIAEERRPGATSARNRGLELVTTPWVMFFDSDDVMLPDHCLVAMSYTRRSNADVVGWSLALVDGSGRRVVKPFAGRDIWFDCLMHGMMSTARWMARTDVVRRVGGWNSEALIWNDIELATRLIASGAAIEKIPRKKATVDVFYSADSITAQPWLRRLENIDKVLTIMAPAIPPQRAYLLQYKRVVAAAEAMRISVDSAVHAAASALYGKAVAATSGALRRKLMHLVFRYLSRFSRGGVAIFSLFDKHL